MNKELLKEVSRAVLVGPFCGDVYEEFVNGAGMVLYAVASLIIRSINLVLFPLSIPILYVIVFHYDRAMKRRRARLTRQFITQLENDRRAIIAKRESSNSL